MRMLFWCALMFTVLFSKTDGEIQTHSNTPSVRSHPTTSIKTSEALKTDSLHLKIFTSTDAKSTQPSSQTLVFMTRETYAWSSAEVSSIKSTAIVSSSAIIQPQSCLLRSCDTNKLVDRDSLPTSVSYLDVRATHQPLPLFTSLYSGGLDGKSYSGHYSARKEASIFHWSNAESKIVASVVLNSPTHSEHVDITEEQGTLSVDSVEHKMSLILHSPTASYQTHSEHADITGEQGTPSVDSFEHTVSLTLHSRTAYQPDTSELSKLKHSQTLNDAITETKVSLNLASLLISSMDEVKSSHGQFSLFTNTMDVSTRKNFPSEVSFEPLSESSYNVDNLDETSSIRGEQEHLTGISYSQNMLVTLQPSTRSLTMTYIDKDGNTGSTPLDTVESAPGPMSTIKHAFLGSLRNSNIRTSYFSVSSLFTKNTINEKTVETNSKRISRSSMSLLVSETPLPVLQTPKTRNVNMKTRASWISESIPLPYSMENTNTVGIEELSSLPTPLLPLSKLGSQSEESDDSESSFVYTHYDNLLPMISSSITAPIIGSPDGASSLPFTVEDILASGKESALSSSLFTRTFSSQSLGISPDHGEQITLFFNLASMSNGSPGISPYATAQSTPKESPFSENSLISPASHLLFESLFISPSSTQASLENQGSDTTSNKENNTSSSRTVESSQIEDDSIIVFPYTSSSNGNIPLLTQSYLSDAPNFMPSPYTGDSSLVLSRSELSELDTISPSITAPLPLSDSLKATHSAPSDILFTDFAAPSFTSSHRDLASGDVTFLATDFVAPSFINNVVTGDVTSFVTENLPSSHETLINDILETSSVLNENSSTIYYFTSSVSSSVDTVNIQSLSLDSYTIQSELYPLSFETSSILHPTDSETYFNLYPTDSETYSELYPNIFETSSNLLSSVIYSELYPQISESHPTKTSSNLYPINFETSSELYPPNSELYPTKSETSSNLHPTNFVTSSELYPTKSETSSNLYPTSFVTSSLLYPTKSESSYDLYPTSAELYPTKSESSFDLYPTRSNTPHQFYLTDSDKPYGSYSIQYETSSELYPTEFRISSVLYPTSSETSHESYLVHSETSSELYPTKSETSSELYPTKFETTSELYHIKSETPESTFELLPIKSYPTKLEMSSELYPTKSEMHSVLDQTQPETSSGLYPAISETSSEISETSFELYPPKSETSSRLYNTQKETSSGLHPTKSETLEPLQTSAESYTTKTSPEILETSSESYPTTLQTFSELYHTQAEMSSVDIVNRQSSSQLEMSSLLVPNKKSLSSSFSTVRPFDTSVTSAAVMPLPERSTSGAHIEPTSLISSSVLYNSSTLTVPPAPTSKSVNTALIAGIFSAVLLLMVVVVVVIIAVVCYRKNRGKQRRADNSPILYMDSNMLNNDVSMMPNYSFSSDDDLDDDSSTVENGIGGNNTDEPIPMSTFGRPSTPTPSIFLDMDLTSEITV